VGDHIGEGYTIRAMLNYACEAGEAGNGYTATLWRRRQPLWWQQLRR